MSNLHFDPMWHKSQSLHVINVLWICLYLTQTRFYPSLGCPERSHSNICSLSISSHQRMTMMSCMSVVTTDSRQQTAAPCNEERSIFPDFGIEHCIVIFQLICAYIIVDFTLAILEQYLQKVLNVFAEQFWDLTGKN